MFEFGRLELRFYPREELATIAGLDAKGHNFSAQMKRSLDLWGYEYEFKPRHGFTITRVPTTPEERLIEILRRDVHIDTQVDPLQFSCFMSAFILIPDFFSMPWSERETMLREYFDVTITDRTMMNWRNKLGQSEYLYGGQAERNLWHTFVQDGKKMREKADPESPEYKQYCALRSGILAEYAKMGISARSIWGDMVHQLYHEHGVYYYCKSIEFNGIKWKELDYIHDLTLEILRTKTD
jgi:hypothetical protein